MKSRVTVEIDYNNGNRPCLEIEKRKSDDVRDGLIHKFIEDLGYDSNWLRIENTQAGSDGTEQGSYSRYRITPIPTLDLSKEAEEMMRRGVKEIARSVNFETAIKWMREGFSVRRKGQTETFTIDPDSGKMCVQYDPIAPIHELSSNSAAIAPESIMARDWEIAQ